MPVTFLHTGETGKLDMIPELQELVIAVGQDKKTKNKIKNKN